MGDLGDFWRDVNAARKERRQAREPEAREAVEIVSRAQGVTVTHHTQWHVKFEYRGRAVDFYPSTQNWSGRKPRRTGHGIGGACSFLGLKWAEVKRAAELEAEQYDNLEDEA